MAVFEGPGYGNKHLPFLRDREPHVAGIGDPGVLTVGVYCHVFGVLVGLVRSEDLHVIVDIVRFTVSNSEADIEQYFPGRCRDALAKVKILRSLLIRGDLCEMYLRDRSPFGVL